MEWNALLFFAFLIIPNKHAFFRLWFTSFIQRFPKAKIIVCEAEQLPKAGKKTHV